MKVLLDWNGSWDIDTGPLQIPLQAQPTPGKGLLFSLEQIGPEGHGFYPPHLCPGLVMSAAGLDATIAIRPPEGQEPMQPPGGFHGLHLLILEV